MQSNQIWRNALSSDRNRFRNPTAPYAQAVSVVVETQTSHLP